MLRGKSTDNSKENSKLKPSTKRRFSFGFRSSNFRRQETSHAEAYEETVINHKQTFARKAIKSKLLKISKSIKKIRRQTVATIEDEYDTPNPVIESNERHGLPVPYKSTSPLVITNRCNNLASEHFVESGGLKNRNKKEHIIVTNISIPISQTIFKSKRYSKRKGYRLL
ncbi:unnamed protein product [Mytilus coruscus]|uniref:Uncharacterized protein n=1 Tax=Mytilus coruscus TaxID=42192 RepID=A0A6J8E0H0_MYTCO|nr:unnamed protein product [Mytilus coruscus]